jgi:hypothetical protein
MFSIVTAYHREPEHVLARSLACVEALQADVPVRHYVIADGHPQTLEPSPDRMHIILPEAHGDAGDTPRMVGAMLAIREGCEGLMFLDADNVLYPDHVRTAYATRKSSGCDIVLARRDNLRPDGSVLPFTPEEDNDFSHVDTGCFVFFGESVYRALEWARVPREVGCFGDRVFWQMLRKAATADGVNFGAMPHATVGYYNLYTYPYLQLGEEPPENARDSEADAARIAQWWAALPEERRRAISKRLGIEFK